MMPFAHRIRQLGNPVHLRRLEPDYVNCVKGYQGRELAVTEGLSPHHPCRNYVLAAEQLADRDG